MRKTPNHFSCQRGKWVFIKLHNGCEIIDKFIEKKSNAMILENNGRILNKNVKIFALRNHNKTENID